MIYILAGDHKQAEWLAIHLDKKPSEWRYIAEHSIVDRGVTVLLWGTCYRRGDYHRTLDSLLLRGATVLRIDDDVMRRHNAAGQQ